MSPAASPRAQSTAHPPPVGNAGDAGAQGRTLISYLALPRPKDVAKGLLFPVTFGLGVLSVGQVDAVTLWRALVVWIALEFLVYQARYQWNDIRGFAADQRHPDQKSRGRLPGPIERARPHVAASYTVALFRLAATAGLVVLLPGLHLGWILGVATGAVFGIAVLYEALRTRGTGRTGMIPSPIRPALVGLWIVVGAGYAVRGVAGLAVAIDLTERPVLAASATLTLWASGVAFVTTVWALEATAFARLEGRKVVWSAQANQAREHLLALVRWLPAEVGRRNGAPMVGQAKDWPALRGRTPASAPWNLAMVVSGTAAGLTGRLLAGASSPAEAFLAGASAAVATVVVLSAARWRQGVALLAALALVAVLVASGASSAALGVLPWLGVIGAHLLFTHRSLRTREQGLGRVAAALRSADPPAEDGG